MWLVKYLLFFSTAIVSMLGAGTVVAGAVVFFIFNRLIPPVIANLLKFEFLEALPRQLAIIGVVVCLSTLIGCCGAILDGSVGKWLLITYTIELTAFVVLNIFVVGVLHLAHQKTASSEAVASPLTMDPTAIDTTLTLNSEHPDHVSESMDGKPFLLRQRRAFYSGIVNKTKSAIGTVVGGAMTVAEIAKAGLDLAAEFNKLVLNMFEKLNTEEEKAVEWIRPILGLYTGPVFRFTNRKVVKAAWAGAIGVEIIFILLNIYLCTTKNRHYRVIEYY